MNSESKHAVSLKSSGPVFEGEKALTGKSVKQEVLYDHDDNKDLNTDILVCVVDVAANADGRELGSSLDIVSPIP
jgi:hypothetical protein